MVWRFGADCFPSQATQSASPEGHASSEESSTLKPDESASDEGHASSEESSTLKPDESASDEGHASSEESSTLKPDESASDEGHASSEESSTLKPDESASDEGHASSEESSTLKPDESASDEGHASSEESSTLKPDESASDEGHASSEESSTLKPDESASDEGHASSEESYTLKPGTYPFLEFLFRDVPLPDISRSVFEVLKAARDGNYTCEKYFENAIMKTMFTSEADRANLCVASQVSVSSVKKFGTTSFDVSDKCSADIGIFMKGPPSSKVSPKYELALAVLELKCGDTIFKADATYRKRAMGFSRATVDTYHLGPVMQAISYVMAMVLPSLRSRGYSGPLYTAVINARKGEKTAKGNEAVQVGSRSMKYRKTETTESAKGRTCSEAVENDTGVFALALRLDPPEVWFGPWTVVIEKCVRYSDTNACHLVTDIVLNTLARSLQTYITTRYPTALPVAPLFGPLPGTELVLSPCPQLSDNGDPNPSTIHYGELLVVVDAAKCRSALELRFPEPPRLLFGTYDDVKVGHLIKLVGVNHIVPCRDLTHPPHYWQALRDVASALRDQQLVEKDQQHAKELVEKDQQHAQQLARLERELREQRTERGLASELLAAPRPVDPLESVPAQPVTPPAQSELDVLHRKIGEVLVCAGKVPSGSFMVMKNVDSRYVRVTLEDVQKWRTFFEHVVTNFLLPLAELDLVHDDLRPDCANLRCTKNDDEAVTNVCILDLDSLRPFDNGMFDGTDGRYPRSQTCLDVYSFVAAQTLLIAFCAAETVVWPTVTQLTGCGTLAERGSFLMNHSVWASSFEDLELPAQGMGAQLYGLFNGWIREQSTDMQGLSDMVRRIRNSEKVTRNDVESLANLSLSSSQAA